MSIVRDAGYSVTARVPLIEVQDQQIRADINLPQMQVDGCRGLCIDASRVYDFHSGAADPSQNGTLRHPDINLVLSHRAQEKVDTYRAGFAAQDIRRDFLPAVGGAGVVSTSGRIHGEFLRLLYLLADNKTKLHFWDLGEAIDVDSEAYCWRRSGFFWRMPLPCALIGKANPRSRAGRPRV